MKRSALILTLTTIIVVLAVTTQARSNGPFNKGLWGSVNAGHNHYSDITVGTNQAVDEGDINLVRGSQDPGAAANRRGLRI